MEQGQRKYLDRARQSHNDATESDKSGQEQSQKPFKKDKEVHGHVQLNLKTICS